MNRLFICELLLYYADHNDIPHREHGLVTQVVKSLLNNLCSMSH